MGIKKVDSIFSPPFIPFRDQISNLDSFHIIYINGYDLDDEDLSGVDPSSRSIVSTADRTTTALVKSIIIQDRFSCFTLLKTKGDVKQSEFNLDKYFEEKKNWRYSMCEMYPIRIDEINITNFTGDEVLDRMMRQTEYIGLRVWYIEK